MTARTNNVEQLDAGAAGDDPVETLAAAFERFDHIALSFSGAEDVVLVDMATRIRPDVTVFTLDTGRLHPETYAFIEVVRSRYKLNLEVLFPDTLSVQELVRQQGLFDFYQRGHKECCSVRKVEPLRRKLSELDAWITGQRRDQSVGTRGALQVVERDAVFEGRGGDLVKFNPLACWTSNEVWRYIRDHELPYNALHGKGYVSIGCQPCTRSVLPGQHEREGRWWWEQTGQKECGLHAGNLRRTG